MPDLASGLFESPAATPNVSYVPGQHPLQGFLDTFGDPSLMDESVPQERRVNRFLSSHAYRHRPWEAVQEEAQRYFPHLNTEALRTSYEPMRQQVIQRETLDDARAMLDDHPNANVNHQLRAIRNAIPLVGTIGQIYDDVAYNRAKQRVASGSGTPDDYDTMARYESFKSHLQQEQNTFGGKAYSALRGGVKIAGEIYAGGMLLRGGALALRGLGVMAPLAAEGAAGAATTAASGGLLASGGRYAAQQAAMLAATPGMWAPEWTSDNVQHGRDAFDPRGLPPALARGYAQMLILGSLGAPISKIGGATVSGFATRTAARGVAFPFEQQIADLVNHKLGFQAGYGTLEELAKGKAGNAMQDLVIQAITGIAFGTWHEATEGLPKKLTPEQTQATKDLADTIKGQHEAGKPATQAARTIIADVELHDKTIQHLEAQGPESAAPQRPAGPQPMADPTQQPGFMRPRPQESPAPVPEAPTPTPVPPEGRTGQSGAVSEPPKAPEPTVAPAPVVESPPRPVVAVSGEQLQSLEARVRRHGGNPARIRAVVEQTGMAVGGNAQAKIDAVATNFKSESATSDYARAYAERIFTAKEITTPTAAGMEPDVAPTVSGPGERPKVQATTAPSLTASTEPFRFTAKPDKAGGDALRNLAEELGVSKGGSWKDIQDRILRKEGGQQKLSEMAERTKWQKTLDEMDLVYGDKIAPAEITKALDAVEGIHPSERKALELWLSGTSPDKLEHMKDESGRPLVPNKATGGKVSDVTIRTYAEKAFKKLKEKGYFTDYPTVNEYALEKKTLLGEHYDTVGGEAVSRFDIERVIEQLDTHVAEAKAQAEQTLAELKKEARRNGIQDEEVQRAIEPATPDEVADYKRRRGFGKAKVAPQEPGRETTPPPGPLEANQGQGGGASQARAGQPVGPAEAVGSPPQNKAGAAVGDRVFVPREPRVHEEYHGTVTKVHPDGTISVIPDGESGATRINLAKVASVTAQDATKPSVEVMPSVEHRTSAIGAPEAGMTPESLAQNARFGQPLSDAEMNKGGVGGGQEQASGAIHRKEVALKNEITDLERDKAGREAILRQAAKANPQAWKEANAKIAVDPAAPSRLADELATNNRPASLEENAMLLHHRVALANEYARTLHEALDLFKQDQAARRKGITDPAMKEKLKEAYAKEEALSAAIDKLDKVIVDTGSAAGSAFQFRKQLVALDYSLSSVIKKAEVAKKEPLTKEEKSEIADAVTALETQQKIAQEAGDKMTEAGTGSRGPEYKEERAARIEAAKKRDLVIDIINRHKWNGLTPAERAWYMAKQLRVGELISGPVTAGRVGGSSALQIVKAPVDSTIGSIIRELPGFKQIAEKAPVEGRGYNAQTEGEAFKAAMTDGIQAAKDIIRTGKSDLDILHGPTSTHPRTKLDFFGDLHSAEKAPAVQGQYERAFQSIEAHEKSLGHDVTSQGAIEMIEQRAYKESLRAKFQEDNAVVKAIDNAIAYMQNPKNSIAARALGYAADLLIPIRRTPMNIIADALNHIVGIPRGIIEAKIAWAKGLENLKPEQADHIIRMMKKGTLGLPLVALGFYAAKNAGGFYSGKRDETDLKPGEIKIGSLTIPAWVTAHHPVFMALQVGATAARSREGARRGDVGAVEGFARGMGALLEEVPLVREQREIEHMLHGSFGETARSFAVPQIVQWLARVTDNKDSAGNPVRRRPETFGQQLEMGVPGFRQRVPQ